METVYIECDTVLNSTMTSDRIDGSSSGNVPFVVVRQAVAASVAMDVGHAGLIKLSIYKHKASDTHLIHKTLTRHM